MIPVPEPQEEAVRLLWRPANRPPSPEDFDGEAATSWTNGAEAIRQAMDREWSSVSDEAPWIRVGTTIYDPEQIRSLHDSKVERDTGAEEPMKGDEPWE